MTTPDTRNRFYRDLAAWWPLISPVEDYREEAAYTATLLRRADREVHEVLELGSGGGHNAAHLEAHFALTLVDLAPGMLAMSRELNPGCEHLEGDMRTVRLGRRFDAVLIHDAVDYMTTEADLRAAMETAFVHCRPGGVAVLMPDHTAENHEPGSDSCGVDDPDGRGARLLEWHHAPGPDGRVRVDFAFLLRHADGTVESAFETHFTGLFPEQRWLDLLAEVGFRAEVVEEVTSEPRTPRRIFLGYRDCEGAP